MKRIKLISIFTVMALLCTLFLSACGDSGDSGSGTSDPGTSGTDSTQQPADDGEVYTFTFADYNAESSGPVIAAKEAIAWMEEESGGRIQFEAYYGGTLIEAGDTFAAVSDGMVDCAYYLSGLTTGVQPVGELLSQHWFREMPDMAGITEIYRTAVDQIPEFQEELAQQNIYMVSLACTPHTLTAVRDSSAESINVPTDLTGKVIQASGSSYIQVLQDIGVSGLSMAPSDWYTNFERGICEMLNINWPAYGDFGLCELAESYITYGNNGGFTCSAEQWYFNLEKWNSLPEDIQAILKEGFTRLGDRVVERDMEREAEVMQQEIDAGKLFHNIPESEMQPWYDLALEEAQTWIQTVTDKGYDGQRIFDDYSQIIEDYMAENG